MDFKRTNQKFISRGINLNSPINLIPPAQYPYLLNARSYQDGSIQSRIGVSRIGTIPAPNFNITQVSRINDYVNNNYLRLLGSEDKVFGGQTGFTEIGSGFTSPISILPFRPDQSSRVWAYIGSKTKMAKINTDKVIQNIGVVPPSIIPTMELGVPLFFAPDAPSRGSAAWTNHDSAGGATQVARLTSVTVGTILYNSGTTGWAGVVPTGGNYQDIVEGMYLYTNGTSPSVVEEVHKIPITVAGNFVASIIYDVGFAGLCTIQPQVPMKGLRRNALIQLAGNWIRIISVTNAQNGTSSFRCDTGMVNIAPNDTIVTPLMSFWAYFSNPAPAGSPITAYTQKTTITTGSAGGQGTIAFNLGSPGYNMLNIGEIWVPKGRAVSPDDYVHISMKVDDPSRLIEAKLVLDIDKGTTNTYAITDGNKNAYYKSFRANDFQNVVTQISTGDTAATKAIQLQIQADTTIPQSASPDSTDPFGIGQTSVPLDTSSNGSSSPTIPIPVSPTSQMTLGNSQWTEISIKVAQLIRIGADNSCDLSDIRAVQLRCIVSNDINIQLGNFYVSGTYGPDSGRDLTPIIYRQRFRSSTTGAKSLPGPGTRSGIQTLRQQVILTGVTSTDPQIDKIDWERLGGRNLDWHYIGTTPNSSPTFTDEQLSAAVVINPPLDDDAFQPFPIADTPKSSLVTVAGTAVLRSSGDNFNESWAKGTVIIVGGKATSLYATPIPGGVLQLADSMGTGTDILLEIPEPILAGQPLPVMWGPFYETMFACGTNLDVGSVYFTKPNDPDSAPDTNRIEVVSPSERMQNGIVYDGKCYAFSDKRLFSVLPSPQVDRLSFQFTEVPNGKGLFTPWGLCVGPKIWFLASDGIYETSGGSPVCISDDISPMFPNGDRPGYLVNGIYPVAMDSPSSGSEQVALRLCYHQGFVIFDYIDTNGTPHTLFYDVLAKAWYLDKYFQDTIDALGMHYSESALLEGDEISNLLAGSNHGWLYIHEGTQDDVLPINCVGRTPAVDFGDSRAKKDLGDLVLDLNAKSIDVTIIPYLDNYSSSLSPSIFSDSSRVITSPIEFTNGEGLLARNIGLEWSWSTTLDSPQLYSWEPSYIVRPEDTNRRFIDWEDAEPRGAKFLQGFTLICDTNGEDKVIAIQGDGRTLQEFTVNHNGLSEKAYSLDIPQIANLLRILPMDDVTWRFYGITWVAEPSPELVTTYKTQGTSHDIPGYQFIKDGYIAYMSTTDITFIINVDGRDYPFTIPSSGGVYKKYYLILARGNGNNIKGKLFTYSLVSNVGFRLFKRDSEINLHDWSSGTYITKQPFGGPSREVGARI